MVFNCLQAQIHFFRGNSFCVLLMAKVDLLQKGFAFGVALVVKIYRVFSRDVTAAILVSQNNETAAMFQASPVWDEVFLCKRFFLVQKICLDAGHVSENALYIGRFSCSWIFFYVTQVEILCNEHIIHPFRTMKFIWISEWLNKVREIIKCLFYYCKQGNDFLVFIFATLRHMFKRG